MKPRAGGDPRGHFGGISDEESGAFMLDDFGQGAPWQASLRTIDPVVLTGPADQGLDGCSAGQRSNSRLRSNGSRKRVNFGYAARYRLEDVAFAKDKRSRNAGTQR